MRIGGSLFLIALGAILAFAVTAHSSIVNIQVVGVILMLVGMLALGLTVYWMTTRQRTDVIRRGDGGYRETTYLEPHEPPDGLHDAPTLRYDQSYYR